jgi:hypothetical protein
MMAPTKPPTLYIDQKHNFLEAPPIAMNLPPSWLPSPRGRDPLQYQGPRKKEDNGRCSLMASCHWGSLCCRRRCATLHHCLRRCLLHHDRRLSPLGMHLFIILYSTSSSSSR